MGPVVTDEGEGDGEDAGGVGDRLARLARSEEALRLSEQRFRLGFDHAAIGLAVTDLEARFIEVNPALCVMLGRTEAELLALSALDVTHPDDREQSEERFMRVTAATPTTVQGEKRYLRPDGSVVWALVSRSLIVGADGRPESSYAQIVDITERRQAEEEARSRAGQQAAVALLGRRALSGAELDDLMIEAAEVLATGLDAEVSGVWEVLGDEMCLRAAVGWPEGSVDTERHEITPGSLAAFTLASDLPVIADDLATETRFVVYSAASVLGLVGAMTLVIRVDDVPFGMLGVGSRRRRVFNDDDVHFVEAVANVLASAIGRGRAEQDIRRQALHDALTGLPNRALLLDRIEHALARLGRTGGHLAVLFADLDRFKMVNDRMGHAAGDSLLVAVADRLRSTVRPGDTVARLGGDEFVVLCEDVDGENGALASAIRLSSALERPFDINGTEVIVTLSTGVALVGASDLVTVGPDSVLADADLAMYQAKANGRARAEVFIGDMRASSAHRMATESALRRALERSELCVHYQPIVALQCSSIVGVEALVRWSHVDRGLLAPSEFVPLAEELGLVVPIGGWVLAEACRQAMAWPVDAADFFVSVNLSGRQLTHPGLIADVTEALDGSGLPPHALWLEVTETTLMVDAAAAAGVLGKLKDLGVRLAIDDFGTGYSSLAYLKRFPIDALKVDRTFVEGLGSGGDEASIAAAIVLLADVLGLRAVAEGVERADQVAELARLGCWGAQGFLLGRPQTAASLAPVLVAGR
jgi:diguanylate cyclase (GGDEF)-like protein/PAS domain S-box-containing protein